MWQGTTDDGCVALANLLGWKVLFNTELVVSRQ